MVRLDGASGELMLSRRGFVRLVARLGLLAGAGLGLSSCVPPGLQPSDSSFSGPGPESTPTQHHHGYPAFVGNESREVIRHGGAPQVKTLPTYAPPSGQTSASPTATPVMWEAGMWMCPLCKGRFGAEGELVEHLLSAHVCKVPGVRVVEEPTYRRYLNEEIARFDQRNIIFGRMLWDREYIAKAGSQAQRQWREGGEELAQGRAVRTGAIWVDDSVGSLAPKYGGFSGHVRGFGGLYDWDDPVAPQKSPIGTPEEMTVRVKEAARFYGADLVGITEINPLWVYSHYFDRETGAYGENETGYKYAIMIGIAMDFGGIRQSPRWGASAATALAYSRMGEVVAKLAKYIRTLGYEAVPSGNDTAQNIPLAIDAGFGELGRLGLLLTPEYGARQRLCKVLTNLPLVADKPIDFGMQRFCETCMACAHACPAKAIPKGERSLERTSISNRPGIKRWHVNVENCYLFWRQNGGVDCSNCVAACPWSQQNRPWL